MIRLLSVLCLLASLLWTPGCASTPSGIVLPALPAFPPGPAAQTFTGAEVYAALRTLAPSAAVDTSDSTFTTVSHEWLTAMVRWTDQVYNISRHGYTAESYDCDKFAKAFTLACEWSAGNAGVKAQPLVARIYVLQERAFAGVGAGGAHALVGFKSDRGYFVLEPQGGRNGVPVFLRLVPLKDYPNRIVRVKIGG